MYYCTNCDADLEEQDGFNPDESFWTCTMCGQALYGEDDHSSRFPGIMWYCDSCNEILNKQNGFTDECDYWTCTECGYNNPISEDEIIDEKKYRCGKCDAYLEDQCCFSPYDEVWECTECGTLLKGESFNYEWEEYQAKHLCENCNAILEFQTDFRDYSSEHICEKCNERLTGSSWDKTWMVCRVNTCQICNANLEAQYGFSEDAEVWQCEECNNYLEYSGNSLEWGKYIPEHICGNCDAILEIQEGFSKRVKTWICIDCNEKLVGDRWSTYWHCVEEEDDTEEERNNDSSYQDFVFSESSADGFYCEEDYMNYTNVDWEEKKRKKQLKRKRIKAFLFNKKKIRVEIESEHIIGNMVNVVKKDLTKIGFTKIKLIEIKDLYVGQEGDSNSVQNISINGSYNFFKENEFPYDSEIIIKYHTKREFAYPYVDRDVKKLNGNIVKGYLNRMGYTNIVFNPIFDLNKFRKKKDGRTERVTMENGEKFRKGNYYDYDTKMIIHFHTFKK
jgi:hypothetical protein